MLAAIFSGGANDAITAVLVIAVGAVLRGIWSLQQRIGRLEGIDEMKERIADTSREEPVVRRPYDHSPETKED